ncbi:L,D-transpeptidase [Pseudonocardia sulfidoxydans]|uniref:L,D-transpeptidase n=1 Tax=Pseudonocardia sulfidoxydans TaxID=54011 RepID=UPI001FE59F3F|nr:L,D-transpeptidase [Pseudonocardia sulfidoxydans]
MTSRPVRTRRALVAAALVAITGLAGTGVALAAPAGPPPAEPPPTASGLDPVRADLPVLGTAPRTATTDAPPSSTAQRSTAPPSTTPPSTAPPSTTTTTTAPTTRATAQHSTTPRTTTAPAARPDGVAGTPCTATARACVDLATRTAWLLDGDQVVRGPVAMQHGGSEYPTPTGTFAVQWKAEQYTSREFGTPMPYSVFFAPGGVAFHEGRQDTPSAGCVKLVHDDAKAWFSYLQVGDEVQVH